MAPTGRNEGRGETSGPAGSKSGGDADGAAVETSDDTAADSSRKDSGRRERAQAKPIQVLLTAPLVYEVRTKKRKKKYSKGLKDAQRLEDGLGLASKRIARSIEQGLRTYRRRRNKSARRKKDGAIRDGLENVSIGLGRTLRVASDAPYDLARKVNSKRFSRGLRNTIRFFTLPLFR